MDHVHDIADLIETLAQSGSFHALMIQGPAGLGKTTAVELALKALNRQAKALGSYSTPLHLFNFLADNPDSLILVDDVAGVFQSSIAMAILKAATGTLEGPRRVAWGSTRAQTVKDEFEFSGKIIFICNSFPDGPDAEAIRSRSISYDLSFTKDIASKMLLDAASSVAHYPDTELAVRVAKFLNKKRSGKNSNSINLRTLKMGYEMASSRPEGRWQQLLEKLIPGSEASPETIVKELQRSGLRPKAQEEEFERRTGLKRRTFFKLRKDLGMTRSYRVSR